MLQGEEGSPSLIQLQLIEDARPPIWLRTVNIGARAGEYLPGSPKRHLFEVMVLLLWRSSGGWRCVYIGTYLLPPVPDEIRFG